MGLGLALRCVGGLVGEEREGRVGGGEGCWDLSALTG
jgi:hypothetical protein